MVRNPEFMHAEVYELEHVELLANTTAPGPIKGIRERCAFGGRYLTHNTSLRIVSMTFRRGQRHRS